MVKLLLSMIVVLSGGYANGDSLGSAETTTTLIAPPAPSINKANDACLSQDTVRRYEIAARPAMNALLKTVAERNTKTTEKSLQNVRLALMHSNGGRSPILSRHADLGQNPDQASKRIEKYGFVNLLDCPGWKGKLFTRDGKLRSFRDLPLGAVIVHRKGNADIGAVRMVTPEGCFGPGFGKRGLAEQHPKRKRPYTSCNGHGGNKLAGVYVKIAN